MRKACLIACLKVTSVSYRRYRPGATGLAYQALQHVMGSFVSRLAERRRTQLTAIILSRLYQT